MNRRLMLLAFAVISALTCGGDDLQKPMDDGQLIDACVRATACGMRPYPRVANCIDAYYGRLRVYGQGPIYNDIYQCINSATGCEEMFRCFGVSENAGRCEREFTARCDGDTAVSCELLEHRVYLLDCSAAGLTCAIRQSESFSASCTTGTCGDDFGARCDGDRALTCNDGVVSVEECGAQGLTCNSGDCIGPGDECSTHGGQLPDCDGDVAVLCVGGRLQRRDCHANPVATHCVNGACVAANDDCLDDFDRCDGDDLQTCLDGRWKTVNCSALGLGPCLPDQNGASCGRP